MTPWQPEFDACSVRQEQLAREYGARFGVDAVQILEMAQALYEAERDDLGPTDLRAPLPFVEVLA